MRRRRSRCQRRPALRTLAADPVRCIVARQPLPQVPGRTYARGLRLRWCRLRLAVQPAWPA